MFYINDNIYFFHLTDKLIPLDTILKIFGQVKIQILKTKQEMNLNYKEICSPILDRCRFVFLNIIFKNKIV